MNLNRRVGVACLILLLMLGGGTLGYRVLVGGTLLDGLYMTVITVSTVGYGEVVPGLEDSAAGRVFTMILILGGMGLLVYVAGSLTAFFVEGELTNLIRRRKMNRQIEALRDHVVVCGYGRTGQHVADELEAVHQPFVILETSRQVLEPLVEDGSRLCLEGDATDEALLERAGVDRARGVVTVLPSDKDNLVVAFTARQRNRGARIVARGEGLNARERILHAGADAVVFPSHIGGLRLVSELIRPQVVNFLDRMLRPGRKTTWRFGEVEVAPGAAAVGRTIGSLRIQERLGLPILALADGAGEDVTYYPSPETVLRENHRLVVLAEHAQLERLRELVASGG